MPLAIQPLRPMALRLAILRQSIVIHRPTAPHQAMVHRQRTVMDRRRQATDHLRKATAMGPRQNTGRLRATEPRRMDHRTALQLLLQDLHQAMGRQGLRGHWDLGRCLSSDQRSGADGPGAVLRG